MPGRLVLLFAAYSPVGLIIGARAFPSYVAYAALILGIFGVTAWLWFLRWLPKRQQREVQLSDLQLVDTEVTGYIVSILLPLVAAGDPSAGDIVAYAICAALVLFVAYVTDLAAVNPFIYAFGYRVARGRVEGNPAVLLVSHPRQSDGNVTVVTAIGVILVIDQDGKAGGQSRR